VAKNRINAHIQELRKNSVVEPLGGNKFKVDAERLAQLSGISTEAAK